MKKQMKGNVTQQGNKSLDVKNRNYLKVLLQSSWTLSYSALWQSCHFSGKEIKAAKNFIYQFITTSEDPYKAYLSFSQRVLMARDYVARNNNRFVPMPSLWFSRENQYGFAGTKKWYEKLMDTRSSLPVYKIEIKAMAEAVLEMREEPSKYNFNYWTNYFRERNCAGLYQLFLSSVINGQYEDF